MTYHTHPRWYFDHDAPLDRIETPILVVYVHTPLSHFAPNAYGCLVNVGADR